MRNMCSNERNRETPLPLWGRIGEFQSLHGFRCASPVATCRGPAGAECVPGRKRPIGAADDLFCRMVFHGFTPFPRVETFPAVETRTGLKATATSIRRDAVVRPLACASR